MKFLNEEIESAYYASPLPLEGSLAHDKDYIASLDGTLARYRLLSKSLSPQQLPLLVDFCESLAGQHDSEIMYSFQCGWLAAKGETE